MSASKTKKSTKPKATKKTKPASSPTVKAAFGAVNRARLIDMFLAEQAPMTRATAWKYVYRLLLWIDQTTGLAHCYESDKCQPGKPWYGRSLAFHDWASSALEKTPLTLSDDIDWLFRRATTDLAAEVLRTAKTLAAAGEKQRAPFADRGFPRPGEDPELVAIVRDVLGSHLSGTPSPDEWQRLVQRVRQYLMVENKRRNLVGEGFEDVLATVIRRSPGGATLDIRTRCPLDALPGFGKAREGDKANKVDLAIISPKMRTLVTAKWSLRADREKQFQQEHQEYVRVEASNKPFQFVFVTNEFDPARLMRACGVLQGGWPMFAHVVHINTDALKATYGGGGEDSVKKVLSYIEEGRLISLGAWLERLASD